MFLLLIIFDPSLHDCRYSFAEGTDDGPDGRAFPQRSMQNDLQQLLPPGDDEYGAFKSRI